MVIILVNVEINSNLLNFAVRKQLIKMSDHNGLLPYINLILNQSREVGPFWPERPRVIIVGKKPVWQSTEHTII